MCSCSSSSRRGGRSLRRCAPSRRVFADDAVGHDIAPRVAARLGAAFTARPTIEVDDEGVVSLTRAVYGGKYTRRLELDDLERSVVATVAGAEGALEEVGTE